MTQEIDKSAEHTSEHKTPEHSPKQRLGFGRVPERIKTAYTQCYVFGSLIGSFGGFIGYAADHNGFGLSSLVIGGAIVAAGGVLHIRATQHNETIELNVTPTPENPKLFGEAPDVAIDSYDITLKPFARPLIVLNLFNNGFEMAKNYEVIGFYAWLPLDFTGPLENHSDWTIKRECFDIPGRTKMSVITMFGLPMGPTMFEDMITGKSLFFFYLEGGHIDKRGRKYPVQYCWQFEPILQTTVVAPKRFWPLKSKWCGTT